MLDRTRLVLVSGHAFGAAAFAGILSSDGFLEDQLEVSAVIGLPEEKARKTVGYRSPAPLAAEHEVQYLDAPDGRLAGLAGLMRSIRPHYLLVIGWSSLICPEVLGIPVEAGEAESDGRPDGVGCIGMHPTKLPEGRGQAPIPWTIIKGLSHTALSVFFLEEAADTGAVIAQYPLEVRPRETASSLFYKMEHVHFRAGAELAAGLAHRSVTGSKQDESAASRWPRRRPDDGELTSAMTCEEVDRQVRALLGPYPRAFVDRDGSRIPVRGVVPLDSPHPHPRLVQNAEGSVFPFRCADGVVGLIPDSGNGPAPVRTGRQEREEQARELRGAADLAEKAGAPSGVANHAGAGGRCRSRRGRTLAPWRRNPWRTQTHGPLRADPSRLGACRRVAALPAAHPG
jgi:methionyl-tRNA formyltransferase